MRNRAKCKLCGDIVESFHSSDSQGCKCGRIGVFGGSAMRSWADDYANFLRVDDLGNEIIIEYREQKKDVAEDNNPDKPPKELRIEELIQELESFTQYINRLPEHELKSPVSQSEMAIFMLIVTAILKKGLLPNDNT